MALAWLMTLPDERALELVDLCVAQAQGRIRPTVAVVDCEMAVTIHTSREPARSFVDRLQALEGHNGVLSISLTHGFPWGDVADMGTKVFVYTDNDPAAAQALQAAVWPGNVRELEHVVSRAALKASGREGRAGRLHSVRQTRSSPHSPSSSAHRELFGATRCTLRGEVV